jgi:hypothetical protein
MDLEKGSPVKMGDEANLCECCACNVTSGCVSFVLNSHSGRFTLLIRQLV